MSVATLVRPLNSFANRLEVLAPVLALLTRLYVGWVFLKSGYLKLADWQSTLFLFQEEFHVPVLPPYAAAIAGTASELLFSILVMVGLFGRLSALALFAVNVVAVVSYSQVLLSDGFEAAIGQHVLWGFMLIVLAIHGPGALSLDRLLTGRR